MYKHRGVGHVPSFQTSAIPFLTSSVSVTSGSVTEVSFYNITKFVTIKNTGSSTLRFGFSENGVNGSNYASLAANESYVADFRVSSVFLTVTSGSTTVDVLAGLTSIPAPSEFDNFSGSAGVG